MEPILPIPMTDPHMDPSSQKMGEGSVDESDSVCKPGLAPEVDMVLPDKLLKSITATPENEVFRLLGTYFLYQDQIGWNRTQTLVVLEAGILAAAFSRQGALGPVVLLVGAVFIFWLYKLILRDWQIRDHLGAIVQPVMTQYNIELLPQPAPTLPRGRVLVKRIVSTLIVANALLAVVKLSILFGQSFGWTWISILEDYTR